MKYKTDFKDKTRRRHKTNLTIGASGKIKQQPIDNTTRAEKKRRHNEATL